jgi:hypothetical protein
MSTKHIIEHSAMQIMAFNISFCHFENWVLFYDSLLMENYII